MTGQLRDPQYVAEYLDIPVQTIYQWRTKGSGPRGIRVGRHLRFRQEDLDAWIESQADQPRVGAA